MTVFFALFSLVLYFAVIWLAMEGARERYRNPVWWGFLALFISVFAFIPLVLMGESKADRRRSIEAQERERRRALDAVEEEEEARLRARARLEESV